MDIDRFVTDCRSLAEWVRKNPVAASKTKTEVLYCIVKLQAAIEAMSDEHGKRAA